MLIYIEGNVSGKSTFIDLMRDIYLNLKQMVQTIVVQNLLMVG